MNTAAKGARVENRVRDVLGEHGYDVIRSAASKGGADLVAFTDLHLVFVQVKATQGTISPAERRELLRLARRARALAVVAYTEKDPDDLRRTVVRFRELTGEGPKEWTAWDPK